MLLLLSALAHAAPYEAGMWTWRGSLVGEVAGAGLLVAWTQDQGNNALLYAGAGLLVVSPIVGDIGALVATGAAPAPPGERLPRAPAIWGLASSGMCVTGNLLNYTVTYAGVPDIGDCAFSIALPTWQASIAGDAYHDALAPSEDEEAARSRPHPTVGFGIAPTRGGAEASISGTF